MCIEVILCIPFYGAIHKINQSSYPHIGFRPLSDFRDMFTLPSAPFAELRGEVVVRRESFHVEVYLTPPLPMFPQKNELQMLGFRRLGPVETSALSPKPCTLTARG